jgi:hypothetical protein
MPLVPRVRAFASRHSAAHAISGSDRPLNRSCMLFCLCRKQGDQIHRPFTGVHLLTPRGRLSPIAARRFVAVIYIIITRQMKTDHATHIISNYFSRIHSFVAVVGVVIAIICGLVLLHETTSRQNETGQSSVLQSSKSVISHSVMEITDISVHSVLAKLK